MTDRDIELVSFDAHSSVLEDALAVYTRVWPDRDPDASREGFTRYTGYDDFHGFVAYVDAIPAAVAYGARSYAGVPWHDLAAAQRGSHDPALREAWRLVELAVIPEYRRLGIASMLHDRLLATHACARALVCTGYDNAIARGFYERRGWAYVDMCLLEPGTGRRYVVMGR